MHFQLQSLDIWYLVCFAFVFAALIQFTFVKTITTRSDDEGRLKEEDTEFQERQHAKEKAGEIALKWKLRIKSEEKLRIKPGEKSSPYRGGLDCAGTRSRRISIPFASVPAALRLGPNVLPLRNQFQNSDPLRSRSYGSIASTPSSADEQIGKIVPLYERLRSEKKITHSHYYSDSDTCHSSGLGSVSILDTVFNSPDSSHFYYSPDIVTQKPLVFNSDEMQNQSRQEGGMSGMNYHNGMSGMNYHKRPSIYGSQRTRSGSRLSYLSPLAPDIQRNLSMHSRSLTNDGSLYSLGPSSFHTSKWYYEVGKQNQRQQLENNVSQSHPFSHIPQSHPFSHESEVIHNESSIGNHVYREPTLSNVANVAMNVRSRMKKMRSFDDIRLSDPESQSPRLHKTTDDGAEIKRSNLIKRNRIDSSDSIKKIPSKKLMKKVEERMNRKELVKKIEKVSRILFPLTFILFNFFYWPYIYNRQVTD